jgi:hypothetical protein
LLNPVDDEQSAADAAAAAPAASPAIAVVEAAAAAADVAESSSSDSKAIRPVSVLQELRDVICSLSSSFAFTYNALCVEGIVWKIPSDGYSSVRQSCTLVSCNLVEERGLVALSQCIQFSCSRAFNADARGWLECEGFPSQCHQVGEGWAVFAHHSAVVWSFFPFFFNDHADATTQNVHEYNLPNGGSLHLNDLREMLTLLFCDPTVQREYYNLSNPAPAPPVDELCSSKAWREQATEVHASVHRTWWWNCLSNCELALMVLAASVTVLPLILYSDGTRITQTGLSAHPIRAVPAILTARQRRSSKHRVTLGYLTADATPQEAFHVFSVSSTFSVFLYTNQCTGQQLSNLQNGINIEVAGRVKLVVPTVLLWLVCIVFVLVLLLLTDCLQVDHLEGNSIAHLRALGCRRCVRIGPFEVSVLTHVGFVHSYLMTAAATYDPTWFVLESSADSFGRAQCSRRTANACWSSWSIIASKIWHSEFRCFKVINCCYC